MKEKAQVKMFETVAVMLVFFFLLGFGLAFYFMFAGMQDKIAADRIFEARAMQAAQKISTIPELDCTLSGRSDENCFDLLKLISFREHLEDEMIEQDYFEVFGYADISIKVIYPEEKEYSLYSKLPVEDTVDSKFIQYYVMVYHPIIKNFGFGILQIRYYDL